MGLGKMKTFVDIISVKPVKDSEGFTEKDDVILALEVFVGEGISHLGPFRDLRNRHLLDAALQDEGLGGIEDA